MQLSFRLFTFNDSDTIRCIENSNRREISHYTENGRNHSSGTRPVGQEGGVELFIEIIAVSLLLLALRLKR